MRWPSNLKTVENVPAHKWSELLAMVSNTGWTSVGEREMTLSTSLVAV